ncbi:MAG: hypothetical protein Q9179_007576 [Wetmoreana sp. 5 TL-2023]
MEYQKPWPLLRYHFAKARTEKDTAIDSKPDSTKEAFSLNDTQDFAMAANPLEVQRRYVEEFEANCGLSDTLVPSAELRFASKLNFDFLLGILQRKYDVNTFSYVLIQLCFISNVATIIPKAMEFIKDDIPKEICGFLNRLVKQKDEGASMGRVLPEHVAMRGQQWYNTNAGAGKRPDE